MESQQLGHLDSWLNSRPPWSSSSSVPLRPWTSAQSIISSADTGGTHGATSTQRLIRRFLHVKTAFELDDLTTVIDHSDGIKIGEGTTYVVEKRSVLRHQTSRHISADFVAVKRAKCVVPKLQKEGLAMPSAYLRCLTAVLLESEILLHRPLRGHPNIVHLLGFSWQIGGDHLVIPLLVMELASFGTLTDLFRDHPIEAPEKQELCLDVAQGLEVLHSSMVIHGDIKQDNVLAFPHPHRRIIAKLSDFGHSLATCDQPVYLGTAIYNAPEVHSQNSSARIPLDQFSKCDVFSYGLLVFEVLNGGQRYYNFPETKVFQETLMRKNKNDGDILMSALTFLDSVPMPEDLARICRLVFQVTLRSSPPDRLPIGWNSVKEIFGAILPECPKLPNSSIQAVRQKFSAIESMLEFVSNYESRKFAAEDIIAELRLVAETSLKKEERAQASFDLCLLLTGGDEASWNPVQDDPLAWLMQASILGNKPALIIGQRIFEAHQLPVSHVFTSTTGCTRSVTRMLDESTSQNYYSNAVRYLWSKKIQKRTTRHIKELSKSKGTFIGITDVDLRSQFKNVESAAVADDTFLLHLAICTGTPEDLTFLLSLGSDLNNCTPEGLTPIQLACIFANSEMVTILARHGADASINDADDISPLHWIIFFQEDEILPIVEILAQARANINSCVSRGGRKFFDDLGLSLDATPLWWAVMCRNHSAITALIYHGADFFCERRNPEIESIRSCCIEASLGTVCSDTLLLLLESGTVLFDLTIEQKKMYQFGIGSICSNPFQRWCLHGSAYEKAYSNVLSVLRHFNMSFTYTWPELDLAYIWQKGNETPLKQAAARCDLHLVKALILDEEDVNFRPKTNNLTAIESLLNNPWVRNLPKATETIEFLLDAGADENPVPSPSTPEGESSKYKVFNELLSLALRNKPPVSVFEVLLRRAPRETYYDSSGRNMLGRILDFYEEPVDTCLASMFLDSGTDPNAEDQHKSSGWGCCYTAVAHSVKRCNWRFTELCLDRGSSLEYGTVKGHCRSVAHLAIRIAYENDLYISQDRDLVKYRKRDMNFLSKLLSYPALIKMGIIDKPDFQGITPLMWAIFWALPTCVGILVANGAETTGKWLGKSLPDLVDVCKTFKIPEGFDLSDDSFTGQMRFLEFQSVFGNRSKATFLQRLDEISLILRR